MSPPIGLNQIHHHVHKFHFKFCHKQHRKKRLFVHFHTMWSSSHTKFSTQIISLKETAKKIAFVILVSQKISNVIRWYFICRIIFFCWSAGCIENLIFYARSHTRAHFFFCFDAIPTKEIRSQHTDRQTHKIFPAFSFVVVFFRC